MYVYKARCYHAVAQFQHLGCLVHPFVCLCTRAHSRNFVAFYCNKAVKRGLLRSGEHILREKYQTFLTLCHVHDPHLSLN